MTIEQRILIRMDSGGELRVPGVQVSPLWAATELPELPGTWTVTYIPTGAGMRARVRGERTKVTHFARKLAKRFSSFELQNREHQQALLAYVNKHWARL